MPPEELCRRGPRWFPWADNSEEKEAPLEGRCLPGVLDVQSSLLFLSLSSLFFHAPFHRCSPFPFFPSVLLALTYSYFYRPLYFSPSNAFPSRFDTLTLSRFLLLPSLSSSSFSSFFLSPCRCADYLSFSYSGSPSFLPPGRAAAGSAKTVPRRG